MAKASAESVETLKLKLAEVLKGAEKLRKAAETFVSETSGDDPDLMGRNDADKSRLQIYRNDFAEALNDMKA